LGVTFWKNSVLMTGRSGGNGDYDADGLCGARLWIVQGIFTVGKACYYCFYCDCCTVVDEVLRQLVWKD